MTKDLYNNGAEQSVIGAVLTHPAALLNVASILAGKDFFFLKHGYIWTAILALEKRNDPIDTVTVSNELNAAGQLAEIGGPAYLTELVRNVPTSQHAEVYARIVRGIAQRRELLAACDEIKVLTVNEKLSIADVFEQTEAKLLQVTATATQDKANDIEAIAHRYMTSVEHMIELREQGITPGLPTGFTPVDNIIRGSFKGEVIIIAAPAGAGKSTFNLNIARNRLKAGARVVIFITEMSAEAVTRKFVSMETGIPVDTLKSVTFSPQQYGRFVEATQRISKWKLHIVDGYSGLTPLDIRRELRKISARHAVDNVVIDGLWQMKSNKRALEKRLEIADIMLDLVAIAKEFNLPLDIVHQCSRAFDKRQDKRFRLTDLADSADVERNAYTVLGLYRASYYEQSGLDDLEVIVAKNRDGYDGTAI